MKIEKKSVLSSLGWKFFEKMGTQGANFIVTLILARILSPDDYGSIAIVMVFISIATVFVQGGFNTALIQKKDADDLDFSSVFFFSLAVSIIIYLLFWILSPVIAKFYNNQSLEKVIKVLALILIPGAVNSIQVAYATRNLKFRLIFFSTFISIMISATVGIIFAFVYKNIWALVTQQLVNQISLCVIMFITVKWRPTCQISIHRIRKLINFGSKILISNLMIQFFLEIRSLIIGKVYSSEQLAYFNKGKQFPQTLMESINSTIQTVMLPTYSLVQEDKIEIKNMVRKSIQVSTFIIFPLMLGEIAISKPMICFLLTEKWIEAVPYSNIFAITYMFFPMQISTAQAIKAIGDSGTPLRLELVRKLMEIFLLIITLHKGVYSIALTSIVVGGIGYLISMLPNKKILNYSYREQIEDILPQLVISSIMFCAVKILIKYVKGDLLKIIIGVIFGIFAYALLAIITNNKVFAYLRATVVSILKNKDRVGDA